MNRPDDRVIPLTEPGPYWAQREYLACMDLHIGFAAHGTANGMKQHWHYAFPLPADCCTTIVVNVASIERYVDHDFGPAAGGDWLQRCRIAMAEGA